MPKFNINIKATNLEMTDELRDFTEEKVSSIEKFMSLKDDDEVIVDVEIMKDYGEHHKKGKIYRAEINLQYGSKICRVDKREYDIHSAIDEVVKEMKREVKRMRERKNDLFRKGASDLKKLLKFGKK